MTCHQMVSTRSVSAGKWFQKVSSSASEGSALAPLVTSLGWSALPFPSWWQPAPPREGRHSVNGIFFFTGTRCLIYVLIFGCTGSSLLYSAFSSF